jgi:hypothetical protein
LLIVSRDKRTSSSLVTVERLGLKDFTALTTSAASTAFQSQRLLIRYITRTTHKPLETSLYYTQAIAVLVQASKYELDLKVARDVVKLMAHCGELGHFYGS